jgi:hypothetical protein
MLRVEDFTSSPASTVHYGTLGSMRRVALGRFGKNSSRTYRFTITLPNGGPPPSPTTGDNRYRGSSTSVDFVWTASEANENGPK